MSDAPPESAPPESLTSLELHSNNEREVPENVPVDAVPEAKLEAEASSSFYGKLNPVFQLFSRHSELSEDRPAFLKQLFEALLKSMQPDLLLLFRGEEEARDWSLLHFHGLPKYLLKEEVLNLPRAWQSLPTIVHHEGGPLFSQDISKDRRFIGQVVRGMGLRTFGGITLQSKTKLYGSLLIAFSEPDALCQEEQEAFLMSSELLTPFLLEPKKVVHNEVPMHNEAPKSEEQEASGQAMSFSLDLSGRIQDGDSVFADFLGGKISALKKKPFSRYLSAASHSRYLEALKQLKSGEDIPSLKLSLKLDKGRIRTLKVALSLIKQKETANGVALRAQDVTEAGILYKELADRDALLSISRSAFGAMTASTEPALKIAVEEGFSSLNGAGNIDGFALYRFDPEKEVLQLLTQSSGKMHPLEQLGGEERKHLLWRVIEKGLPTFVSAKPKEGPIKKRLVGEEGLLSYLAVPLKLDGKLWGILSHFSTCERLSELDLHRLAAFGEEIGKVIQQLTSLDDLKKEVMSLSILNEMGQSIFKSLHLEQLLPSILNCLTRMIGASNSYIFLSDAKRHLFAGIAASEQGVEAIRKVEIKMNENSLIPMTARERHAFAIENATQDSRVPKKWLKMFKSRSLLSVPLVSKERTIGVLLIDETRYFRKFKTEEIEQIVAMASQVSGAIENAILHHSVSRHLERLQTLSSAIVNIQEEERRRIAKKLRSETGEELRKIEKDISAIKEKLGDKSPDIKITLDKISLRTEKTIEALQALSSELRPADLDESGLVSTLKLSVSEFESQSKTKVQLQVNGLPKRFPSRTEILLFRVVQEALANISTHAKAESAIVSLEKRDPYLHLFITDDGKGFDVKRYFSSPQGSRKGIGILGMKERVELVGGTFYIDSHPGQGTRISVRIPLLKKNTHS